MRLAGASIDRGPSLGAAEASAPSICGQARLDRLIRGRETAHVARVRHAGWMTRAITQRELRNRSGEIMRGLDRGEIFLVTRNGVPVGELTPLRQRAFVPAEAAVSMFAGAPAIELDRFRQDVDAAIDQSAAPRG